MQIEGKVDFNWLFSRLKGDRKNLFKVFLQIIFRLIKFPFSLVLISLSKNNFSKKQITFSKSSEYSCLTCTGQKEREINAVKSFFYDFNVYDCYINREVSLPNLKRIVNILNISIRNNLYSLIKISEIVDYLQNETDEEDFYLAIDGVTPLNRAIASKFNPFKIPFPILYIT